MDAVRAPHEVDCFCKYYNMTVQIKNTTNICIWYDHSDGAEGAEGDVQIYMGHLCLFL